MMEGLAKELIFALTAKRDSKNPSAFYIDSHGNKHPLKSRDIARFEGKAGTIRRSRKGATRRLANGSRRYVDSGEVDMVAYKV